MEREINCTPEEVVDFAADFYPEAKISARLRLGIRELWRVKDNFTQKGRYAPLDRLPVRHEVWEY